MGYRDDGIFGYWGRIPKTLQNNGFTVAFSGQDSNGSIESNARQIAKSIDAILESTQAEKVNIIAHSKGGLEARYLACKLGLSDKIASITTLSTPHNGSATVDALFRLFNPLIKIGSKLADCWFKILGDKSPNTYQAICSFRTSDALLFNQQNQDVDTIYYQSYGFVMKSCWSDFLMWLPNLVVQHFEGQNDGLLSPQAVEWTNFKPIIFGTKLRGISHCDEVDMRRRKMSIHTEYGITDITDFYVSIAKDLEEKSF